MSSVGGIRTTTSAQNVRSSSDGTNDNGTPRNSALGTSSSYLVTSSNMWQDQHSSSSKDEPTSESQPNTALTSAEKIAGQQTTAESLGGKTTLFSQLSSSTASSLVTQPPNMSEFTHRGMSTLPNGQWNTRSTFTEQLAAHFNNAEPLSEPTSTLPNPQAQTALNTGTQESNNSAASVTGSLAESLLNVYKDNVDATGRRRAAAALTSGSAGNLLAPGGGGSRAALAQTILDETNTAARALEITPFSSTARSTQILSDTVDKVRTLGKVADVVGKYAGPLTGAIEGNLNIAEHTTFGERVANTIGGGLKEADDVAVGVWAGGKTATLTTVAGTALVAGTITAPAGAVVLGSVPLTSTAVGIAASFAYDNTAPDRTFDSTIDTYVEPAISTTIDSVIAAPKATASFIGGIADKIKSWI